MIQKNILSTKTLLPQQKNILSNAGLNVIEEDFIHVSHQNFFLRETPEILLFTSQNAVESVLKNENLYLLKKIPAICVGTKTKALLEKNHFKVLLSKNYAAELAVHIKNYFNQRHFAFFSGSRRMETLPHTLSTNKIHFDEYQVYQTTLTPKTIHIEIHGILFYSPSGVKSFLQKNHISDQKCFCIGTTTATALSGLSDQIWVSQEQTIESTLHKSLSYFKSIKC